MLWVTITSEEEMTTETHLQPTALGFLSRCLDRLLLYDSFHHDKILSSRYTEVSLYHYTATTVFQCKDCGIYTSPVVLQIRLCPKRALVLHTSLLCRTMETVLSDTSIPRLNSQNNLLVSWQLLQLFSSSYFRQSWLTIMAKWNLQSSFNNCSRLTQRANTST